MTISAYIPTVANIGDPDGTRTVTSIVALLVAMGLGLLLLAVWIFRSTRPDHELLAPLEVMGERSWRRGDPVWQRRRLDELRPDGAKPLAPSVAPPELDEAFDAGPTASGFDDLRTPDTQTSGEQTSGEQPVVERRPDEADSAEVGTAPDVTPSGVVGPTLDELPDVEFDQDALAAAREQLERELAASRPLPAEAAEDSEAAEVSEVAERDDE